MTNIEKISKIKSGKYFIIGDIIVFIVAIALITVFTILAFAFNNGSQGQIAEIYKTNAFSKNELLLSVPLNKDATYIYTVKDGEYEVLQQSGTNAQTGESFSITYDLELFDSYNIILIQGGTIEIVDADCGNKNCVSTGKISKSGESINCLPHRLCIKIVGEQSNEMEGDV